MYNMRKIQIILLLGIQVFYASSQDIVPRFPIYYTNSSNANCHRDSSLLEQGLKDKILWAMQMWDASVKSGIGIVSGTLLQYGDFDECLAVKEPIKAKYCLLSVNLLMLTAYNSTDPYTIDYSPYVPVWEKLNDRGIISKQKNNVIKWALCVPSSCKEYDILESLNEFIIQEKLNSSISVSFSAGACSQIDDNRLTLGDLVFCFVIGIYTLIVLLVTIYDYYYFDAVEEKPNNVFLCFSLRRSVKSLMKKNQPITGYNINLLSGIYVFSTVMIVFGHRFGMFQIGGISNYDFVQKMFKYVEFSMWSSHIGMMVDCFFTLSGFLAGIILPFYYDNYKTGIIKVIINRYIRLVPSLLVVIFFYATIFNKIGDGPIWNAALETEKQFCAENWWTSLLFISNYVNSERFCMVQTWYLNCDFQLFVITTVIFYLWKKRPAVIQFSILVSIILCLLSMFYASYSWQLTALSLFYKRIWDNIRQYDYFLKFNIKTQFRAAPYLIGFITGYTLYLRKPNKVSKGETNSLFLGGVLIMFMAYSSGYLFSDPAHYQLGIASAAYATLCTSFWAVGLLMIVISLLIGSTSPVLRIFSWDFLIPLSKLSYNVYLVHMIFQIHSAASRRTPGHISASEWISRTISDLVLSLCVAFLLNVIFEAPCRYFIKYITFKKEQAKGNAPV